MKPIGLFAFLCLLVLTGASRAATITVTSGLPNQGLTPTVAGAPLPDFFWAAGTWNAATQTFTVFASPFADTGQVNGAVTATGPASFNGQQIALFIGQGASIAESGFAWTVLISTSPTAFFPADVSQATGVTFAVTSPAVLNIVGNAPNVFFGPQTPNGHALNFVPEPSSLFFGLLGIAVSLRRRRGCEAHRQA